MQATTSALSLLQAPDGGAALGALDLHEGISDPGPSAVPDPRSGGCRRWPEHLWLQCSDGRRVPGRCRATNQCAYCAKLAAVENSEMLALDALGGSAPSVYAVLTTSRAETRPAVFYRAREAVLKALKRRWPDVAVATVLEFTTGRAGTSGGRRRPHWNLLIKGVPAEELAAASEVIVRVWCARPEVGARPAGQYVGEVAHVGGLMRYLALHFFKTAQAPPPGWSGHRFRTMGGYFAEGTAAMRARARESLRYKRILRSLADEDVDPLDAEEIAPRLRAEQRAVTWSLAGPVCPDTGKVDRRRAREAFRRAGAARSLQAGSFPAPAP